MSDPKATGQTNVQTEMFLIPSLLDGITPLKDGGMSLRFHTQEVRESKVRVDMMEFYQSFGNLLFKRNMIDLGDIPTHDAERGGKTLSQRLRNVLFIEWRDTTDQSMTAEQFYDRRMGEIIDEAKLRLP